MQKKNKKIRLAQYDQDWHRRQHNVKLKNIIGDITKQFKEYMQMYTT